MELIINKFAVDPKRKYIWFVGHLARKDLLETFCILEDTLQGALNAVRNSFLWDIRHKKNELKRLIEDTRLKNKPIPQQVRLIEKLEATKKSIKHRIAEIQDIEKRMEKISEDTYYNGVRY